MVWTVKNAVTAAMLMDVTTPPVTAAVCLGGLVRHQNNVMADLSKHAQCGSNITVSVTSCSLIFHSQCSQSCEEGSQSQDKTTPYCNKVNKFLLYISGFSSHHEIYTVQSIRMENTHLENQRKQTTQIKGEKSMNFCLFCIFSCFVFDVCFERKLSVIGFMYVSLT